MPESKIENFLAGEPTERVIRVATSDPDRWFSLSYRGCPVPGTDKVGRCLLGHALDMGCDKNTGALIDNYPSGHLAWDAESEYMELRRLLYSYNSAARSVRESQRLAGRVCIHLAWRELRSRSDSAARDFLSRVQSGATIGPRPLTPARQ